MQVEARDTDADWRHIGETQPFWGVLTSPEFRTDALTEQALETFYSTGRTDMLGLVKAIRRHADRDPPFEQALDVGCGVGRLSEAMLDYARAVTGYDISPGMLEAARRRSGAVTYTASLPDGPFDWINSFIVFQHMPVASGYALLEDVLDRLAPGGVASLHFTVARHDALRGVDSSKRPRWRWRRRSTTVKSANSGGEPLGAVSMYDYDINVLLDIFRRHGVHDVSLPFIDHGGHYGYIFIGSKAA